MTTRAPPRIAILGLGKAGGSLLASARAADIDVVAKAARLPGLTRTRTWLEADVLFVAVPDDAIEHVAQALAAKRALPKLVVHLSGAKGASALDALRARSPSCALGTFHPLAALDGTSPIPARTFIALEGTSRFARSALSSLAKRMGLSPGFVAEEDRLRYHTGAVVAGNLAVALLHEGVQLMVRSGVPEKRARESLARLLASTAHNAIALPLSQALSGPVARGDIDTLTRHVALLDGEDVALASLYRTLSRVLIDDVSAHDASVRRRLRTSIK